MSPKCTMICVTYIQCQQQQRQSIQQLLGGQRKLTDSCTYLQTRSSIWGENSSPFYFNITGFYGYQIRSGQPLEVTIKRWSSITPDNFTDFFMYATPTAPRGIAQMNGQGVPGMPVLYLGVFKLVPPYNTGGRGFTCDPRAIGYDAFGSVEERRILIKRAMEPNKPYWHNRKPYVRKYTSVLWFPTEMAMNVPSIQFIGKVKSDGHWYEIKSRSFVPYIPPDPMSTMYSSLSQVSSMSQNMRQFERQADAATAAL
ncbi:hypothetical protein LOTGIDRAFT_234387 [Lottia gigantea]|uniref:Reelin domain-containing protein n=1 Tax=Lottia gigantea TaxID=225164 RepID=V4BJ47_LOTGI|nr:hypothetical protein LOTGIDRAFT_234387 [Lottia gigantea]ESO88789.1 hypothetical protein LOTGIDRAFT_234387 [Lottia gigantea]